MRQLLLVQYKIIGTPKKFQKLLVLYLGLKVLTIHVIKSQIHLVRQSVPLKASFSWMQGLPVRVHLPSGEKKSLAWGVADTARQTESLMVGYDMTPNSAVDVVVSAVAVAEEQPYAATLVAIFGDESRRERRVEGVLVSHYLDTISSSTSSRTRSWPTLPGSARFSHRKGIR